MKKLNQALWLIRKEGIKLDFSKILLILSLSLGVSALVALDSFTQRIENTVKRDAKSLLASDLQIQSWRPYTTEIYKALEKLNVSGKQLINQKDFVSSIRFNDQVFTVSARSLEGSEFPFYGEFKTRPQISIESLKADSLIILDKSFEAKGISLGDTISLGKRSFRVVAFLVQEPQTVAAAFSLGPRAIFHTSQLESTGLTGPGSRIFHQILIRTTQDPNIFKDRFRELVPDPHWRVITPDHANRQAGKILERLRAFLSFVAVTALLMGALGTYSVFRSIFIRKLNDYLTLRCLGYSSRTIEYFSLLQAVPIVLGGFALGLSSGWIFESAIHEWATRALEMDLAAISRFPTAVQAALLTGFSVFLAIYFPTREALRVPISSITRESSSNQTGMTLRDSLSLYALSTTVIFLITRHFKFGISFVLGITATAALFVVISSIVNKFIPLFSEKLNIFSLKQGLRQLVRGGAQSQLTIFTTGFSGFLLGIILFVGNSLQNQIDISQKGDIPNVYFMGIPETENENFRSIYPNISLTPVIQARIEAINNQKIQTDSTYSEEESERFFQTREYFITKRDSLNFDERLVNGVSLFQEPIEGKVRISLEESFAKRMSISVGAEITLEVSGIQMQAIVQSIRKVSWLNLKPNFFITIHPQDIVGAPFDSIGLMRVSHSEAISEIQTKMGALYPSVTVIDGVNLSQRLLNVVKQLSISVSSLSLFCLVSSLFVFMGLALSRRQDIQNTLALWKCLGSKKPFIYTVFGIETFSTGLMGGAIGIFIASVSNYFICLKLFDIEPSYASPSLLVFLISAPAILLTVFQVGFTAHLYRMDTQELLRSE